MHRDIGTKFFLYVPTWKELRIQEKMADLQDRVDELEAALKRKAYFRI